jgi:hypothetical protein
MGVGQNEMLFDTLYIKIFNPAILDFELKSPFLIRLRFGKNSGAKQ